MTDFLGEAAVMDAPDFRALLVRARQKFHDYEMDAEEPAPYEHRRLMDEIDAALEAAPAISTPTDDQIMGVWNSDDCEARLTDQEIAENHGMTESECYRRQQIAFARAVLTRYSTPAPVLAAERLPEAEDCDAEGRCWWLTLAVTEGGRGGYSTYWMLGTFAEAGRAASHWLPHWALPLPEAQP